jgi:hypothetical protein
MSIEEDRFYRERYLDQDLQNSRISQLRTIYHLAGVTHMGKINAIVFGAAHGADVLALRSLNPEIRFMAVLDSDPDLAGYEIVEGGKTISYVQYRRAQDFISHPSTQSVIRDTSLFTATRVGEFLINDMMISMPKDFDWLAVTTTNSIVRRQRYYKNFKDLGLIGVIGEHPLTQAETMIIFTPNKLGNRFMGWVQNAAYLLK